MESLELYSDHKLLLKTVDGEKAYLDKDETKNHLPINYNAYQEYIDQHYPNLHIFDIKDKVDIQKFERDNILLNGLDIHLYEGLNSADDIFDSIAKRVYNMGFIGKYSRIANKLENGENYVFTFEEFAHIYPFLRSCQGNAFNLQRLNKIPKTPNEKKYNSYKIYYAKESFYKNIHMKPSILDVELEKRSIFNQSLIIKPTEKNPPGTDWTYLTVDKDDIKLQNNYRNGYDSDEFDNKRYIYEKFVFCVSQKCPGTMRIILDCIHNLVIISMINPHFECLEAQRKRVFDIVRKLFVINNADLEFIDSTYISIPRRYGLSYVESWLQTEEYMSFQESDYTPTFFRYNYNNRDDSIPTWSSQKNRSWISTMFHESKKITSLLPRKRRDSVLRRMYYHNPNILAFEISDIKMHQIKSWNNQLFRKNKLGKLCFRDEWEYYIYGACNEQLREVFRIWRKQYFENTDKLRTFMQFSLDSNTNFAYSYYYKSNKINDVYPMFDYAYDSKTQSIEGNNDEKSLPNLDDEFIKLLVLDKMNQYSNNYNKNKKFYFKSIFSDEDLGRLLYNPDVYVLPYPMNKQIQKNINKFQNLKIQLDGFIIITSSFDELCNCDTMFISDRFVRIEYEDIESEISKKIYKSIHPSDQIYEFKSIEREFRFLMSAYDPGFSLNRILKDLMKEENFTLSDYNSVYNNMRDDDTSSGISETGKTLDAYDSSNIQVKQIQYKFNDDKWKWKTAFMLSSNANGFFPEGSLIEKILSKRTNPEKLKFISFSKRSITIDKTLDMISKYPTEIKSLLYYIVDLTTFILPIDISLCLIKSFVFSNVEVNEAFPLIEKYLPLRRLSDNEPYILRFEHKIIARTVGMARIKINHLKKNFYYLDQYSEFWIGDIENLKNIDDLPESEYNEKEWYCNPKQFLISLRDANIRFQKCFPLNQENSELLIDAIEIFFDSKLERFFDSKFRDYLDLIDNLRELIP
jgi:hypothetical protein